jgi:hypothetical protein
MRQGAIGSEVRAARNFPGYEVLVRLCSRGPSAELLSSCDQPGVTGYKLENVL